MAKDERNADERYDNLQRKENNIVAEKVANAFEFNDHNVESVSLLDHGPLESLSDSEVSPVAETLQSSNAKSQSTSIRQQWAPSPCIRMYSTFSFTPSPNDTNAYSQQSVSLLVNVSCPKATVPLPELL